MLMNNKFSNKNRLIYKMKCLNNRDNEYDEYNEVDYQRIEKHNDRVKK